MKTPSLQDLAALAWQLVQTAGLKEAAFDHASPQCLRDAFWLIQQGSPVVEVVRVMNEEPYAGEKALRGLRTERRRQRRTLTLTEAGDGYEIRFPKDPGEAMRVVLAENGWSQDGQCWRHPCDQVALAFASKVILLRQGVNNVRPRPVEMVEVKFPQTT
jgi:hypothetical protein